MLPLIATLPLSLLLWFFAVVILSLSIGSGAASAYYLLRALRDGWRSFLGAVMGCIVWGGFAWVVGTGALDVGASIIDGLIARLG